MFNYTCIEVNGIAFAWCIEKMGSSHRYTECQSFCPVVRIGFPLTRKRVLLLLLGPGGKGVGTNYDVATDTVLLYLGVGYPLISSANSGLEKY
jgi:hypothetical protein